MNKERDSYYLTLGLQPGTSSDEIKSAFRRLSKLYHPDHDSSLDAEMKYREIRAAYDALKQNMKTRPETTAASHSYSPPPPPGKHEGTAKDERTVYGKEWSYVENESEYDSSSFDFNDLMGENEGILPRASKNAFWGV